MSFPSSFLRGWMNKKHRGSDYDVFTRECGGWTVQVWHEGELLDIDLPRAPDTTDRERWAREAANKIDLYLAPSQDWRMHQDYV